MKEALIHFMMVVNSTRTTSMLSWKKEHFETAVKWCRFWEIEVINMSENDIAKLELKAQVPPTMPQLRCGADNYYD